MHQLNFHTRKVLPPSRPGVPLDLDGAAQNERRTGARGDGGQFTSVSTRIVTAQLGGLADVQPDIDPSRASRTTVPKCAGSGILYGGRVTWLAYSNTDERSPADWLGGGHLLRSESAIAWTRGTAF
jgi:hypothetical protein